MAIFDSLPRLPDGWDSLTPELIILLFAIALPIVGIKNPDRNAMRQFAVIGIGGAFLVTLGSVFSWAFGPFDMAYQGSVVGGGVLAVDMASQMLKLLFLFVALIATIGVGKPLAGRTEEDWGEFFGLLLFATLGMMVVASARELFVLFLGIETASMSSYLLAGMRRDKEGAEASLKYFTIGAIASGLTLFGISLLYGMAGTTTLTGIADAVTLSGGFDSMSTIAVVMVFAGLGFKISSVPFHSWAPDVYSGGPVPLAGVLAAASKAMGFAALWKVFLVGLGGITANWQLMIAILAIGSMFFGNLVAIQQTSIKRMLAYSSIAQAGYLMIALVVGTTLAMTGGFLHLWMNAAMKLGAFIIVGALLWAGVPDNIKSWRGLGARAPFLAFAMLIFLLSMAGLPPLGGFHSKFLLFGSAVQAQVLDDLGWLLWLAVAAVINSAISLFYYLRVIRAMYVQEGPQEKLQVSSGAVFAAGVCAAIIIVTGLAPDWFIGLSREAATAFLTP